MAYDNTHLVKLAALKALAEKVKSDYALKSELTALSGRVDELVTAGGEPNVLTGIKVNGTLLALTEKIADILIAEGKTNGTIAANGVDVPVHGLAALAYKAEVSETELAKALKDAIDAKAKQADLDTLTGEGEGSIKKMIDDAFNDFSTKVSDDGVVNSYKELIDWAATHGAEATKLTKGISENKTAIANLKKYVGTLPEGATATDVVGYIAEAIAALSIGDYAKTTEVTAAINTALADYAKTSDVNTGLGKKADKVAKATNGNFAALDADGNLKDSGKKAADFVATEAGKRLMTDAEGTKLGGVAEGATKVEASETNGNVKINGVDTKVYTEPTDVVHGAIATDTEVTEMFDQFISKWSTDSKWNPSIFMPKEAARTFLKIVDVSVERLGDIDGGGLKAEGIDRNQPYRAMRMDFRDLWNSTISADQLDELGWYANPWVFVYKFQQIGREEALA